MTSVAYGSWVRTWETANTGHNPNLLATIAINKQIFRRYRFIAPYQRNKCLRWFPIRPGIMRATRLRNNTKDNKSNDWSAKAVLRGLSSTRLGRICGRRRAAGAGTACARQGLVLLDHIDLSSRIRADKKPALTVKSYPHWPEAILGTFRVICVRKDIGCGRTVVRRCHGFAVLEGNYGQLVPNRVRTVP